MSIRNLINIVETASTSTSATSNLVAADDAKAYIDQVILSISKIKKPDRKQKAIALAKQQLSGIV
jgi:hypothetical protein